MFQRSLYTAASIKIIIIINHTIEEGAHTLMMNDDRELVWMDPWNIW
jgi:hypothetical protein